MIYKVMRSIRAREDLRSIAIYTKKEWGMAQVERYMQELQVTIDSLSQHPETKGFDLGWHCSGLRRISHRRHYHIFYRIQGDEVQIIRVLHQRRKWDALI